MVTARSAIEVRVLVTERLRSLRLGDRWIEQVGLPYHWGGNGSDAPATRQNDLVNVQMEPNVYIQDKVGTCDIRPGRRPRGPALTADVEDYRRRAGIPRLPDRGRGRLMGRLSGTLHDVSGDAGYDASHPPRMGFFTDTSVCIGCKACEVACKTWNEVPDDGYLLTGMSYDNTEELGASTWRHVAFVEKKPPRAVS